MLNAIRRIGIQPDDPVDLRLQKAGLVKAALVSSIAGFVWGPIYMALGQVQAGWIPFGFFWLTLANTALFARTKNYGFYRFTHTLMMLILPFLLMMRLGGFINSSAVILWSLSAVFGSVVFFDLPTARLWFLAYLSLILVSGLLQPYVEAAPALPRGIIILLFVMNILGVSLLVVYLLYYYVNERNKAYELLGAEQRKSENLLLNILPGAIAEILKQGPRTIADECEEVSILFADLAGFTPLSAKLPPTQMVELLNRIFTRFDSLVEHYGVEKIRTIGDNYMVASGVPVPRPDHAQALCRMALEMAAYV